MGPRVYIVPIRDRGTVLKVRQDDAGEPLIDVKRDEDGESHVCRECELRSLEGEDLFFDQCHLKANAHRVVAEAIFETLEKEGLIILP